MKIYEFENLDKTIEDLSNRCQKLPRGPKKKALFLELLRYMQLRTDQDLLEEQNDRNK